MTSMKTLQIEGQLTKEEFYQKYDNSSIKGINLSTGKAWIKRGDTVNYYRQHSDGSWTNYDCKTQY